MKKKSVPLQIPKFRVEFAAKEKERILRYNHQILESGQLHLGAFTEKFENAFAKAVGTKRAVAVNTGSTALEIIFRAIDVLGRSVLVPSNTNFATAIAARNAGAKLQLYDSGLYPNIKDIEAQASAVKDVKVIVIVHIGGFISPEIYRIREFCTKRGIQFVEDAAHSHGSELNGQTAGSFGYASAFSFVQSKVITTGEGGMIATNDDRLADMARKFRDQGYAKDGLVHELHGNSWRMTEIAAAMGLVQLDRMISRRNHMQTIIRNYSCALRTYSYLDIVEGEDGAIASGYKCIALARTKTEKLALIESMKNNGVQPARGVYDMPLHQQPIFSDAIRKGQKFSLADDFSSRHLCLPLWRTMPFGSAVEACKRISVAIEECLARQ